MRHDSELMGLLCLESLFYCFGCCVSEEHEGNILEGNLQVIFCLPGRDIFNVALDLNAYLRNLLPFFGSMHL